ncbi:MAG: DUF4886 domain-containing protein [Bacteroides sp.]|nr:DUF4886 domain-containing protein [Bacteroides sp.]MBD5338955.1 DUF4886 domain-containing protein [Bacteroides sp.]
MSKIRNLLLSGMFTGTLAAGAVTPHTIDMGNTTVAEDFNSMWNPATSEALMTMPEGWVIERNMDAPRKVGKWSDASSEVMYTGGVSLASNAKNGTWSFGDSSNASDRAIGGLTTTVSNGTRGVSLMTALTNAADTPVDRLKVSYGIEKYRKGANAAGFAVQMYYSTDGENWTSAGDNFHTLFPADSETIGEETVPISTTGISGEWLMADIAPGATLYLAWNISVASGSAPDKAQGLAIDDIEIEASFADASTAYLLIENAIRAKNLSVYSPVSDIFGVAPGMTSGLTKSVNGVEYNLWEMRGEAPQEVVAVADGNEYGPVSLNNSGDSYFCLSSTGLDMIADPESYTGWVDPDRNPFVPSGIYLRGEVNSWGADAEWEFSMEADNTYVLYDKTLSGQFKVADANWSSSCNYGSNGSNIVVDSPYPLSAGTDGNVSCGSYIFDCKRIVLTIIDGTATLLLESDDDDSNLTSVYLYGDFNSWNFMSTTGELKLDENDNLFKGQISMKAGSDGLSRWRIYQRPGMGGAWGLAEDAAEASLAGHLLKGSTGNAAVTPGTYSITFSLEDGAYTFTAIESAPAVMTLNPAMTVLTPENPSTVKVLSLNNSLIHYNDQDFVFNDIAKAMGTDAAWTKHTNLGKPLSYHWNEGEGLAEDGTPGAKMMIRSDAWSHIILQEQSSLPRTQPETFRNSVAQWMDYIRQYCPNPDAVVIIPVNWAYSSDLDNFSAYNNRFLEVYTDIASELGAVVVPVAAAYDNAFRSEGADELATWFSDDRHPTPKATYMAACMEYGAIMGMNPAEITFVPAGISEDEAKKMRAYASEALGEYTNTVSHLEGKIRFRTRLYDDFGIELPMGAVEYSVNGGGTISPEGVFTSDGTRGDFTVTATCGEFTKTATVKVTDHSTEVITYPAISLNADNLSASEDFDSLGLDAEATLPEAWRIDRQTVGTRMLGTYATALNTTTYSGGTSLPSNAKNGVWNFGADGDSDRAPGGITTGVADGTRAINLYTHLVNDGRKPLANVALSYDVEKYRKGNNQAGFAVQLYYSYDGRNWQDAGKDFYTYLAPDNATEGYAEVPGETVAVEGNLPVALGAGLDLYLAWNISVATGDAAQGAMALAIDNVRFEGSLPEVPETRHRIYVDNQTTWDAIGLYAWGDAEIFGAWPGQAPIDEVEEDGVVYTVFGLDAEGGSYNLIFNNWNNNKQLPDYNITADRDYRFRIDDEKVELLTITGVDGIIETTDALEFNGNSLFLPAGESVGVYATDGRCVAAGKGPEMSMENLPKGLYVAVAGKNSKKIIIR